MRLTFKKDNKLKGFTLTEALLYIAIVSIVLTSIVSFYAVVMSTDDRNQTVSALDQNGLQITEFISTSIRNASSVTNPTASQTASIINFLNSTNVQTTIDLSEGVIRVDEGGTIYNLSSNNVTASDLSFKNLTPEDTKTTIKFQFKLTYINPDNRQSLSYSQIFYGSATLR
jgi:Tfp pilus assembly protein PilW